MVALPIVFAGTVGTYDDLVEKVALWLDRDDLTPRIPDFIALLEARLNRNFRVLNQEIQATWTFSGPSYTLPPDFRRFRSLKLVTDDECGKDLVEIQPQRLSQPECADSLVQYYYLSNRALFLHPEPEDAVTLKAIYVSRIEPLTAANDSNWVLDEHPDIYVNGTLLEAAIYIRDEDAIAFLQPRLDAGIDEVNRMSRLDKHGGGPLAPRFMTQVGAVRC